MLFARKMFVSSSPVLVCGGEGGSHIELKTRLFIGRLWSARTRLPPNLPPRGRPSQWLLPFWPASPLEGSGRQLRAFSQPPLARAGVVACRAQPEDLPLARKSLNLGGGAEIDETGNAVTRHTYFVIYKAFSKFSFRYASRIKRICHLDPSSGHRTWPRWPDLYRKRCDACDGVTTIKSRRFSTGFSRVRLVTQFKRGFVTV